jgi:hypothetical protein
MSDLDIRQPDTKTIRTLYTEREDINVDPRYQRQYVWTRHVQKLLVDSVLRGLHIGVMMFRSRMIKSRLVYDVVDGKQRLLTLFAFIDGKFAIADDAKPINGEVIAGKRYADLSEALRLAFSEYALQIVKLRTDDEDLIRLQFVRLQSGKPLTVTQRRMTANGHVQAIVRKLIQHPIMDVMGLKKKRVADHTLVMHLIYYEWKGRLAKANTEALDAFFDAHADDTWTPKWSACVKRIESVFDLMHKVIAPLPYLTRLENKGLAESLYLIFELYLSMQLNTSHLQNLRDGIGRLQAAMDRKYGEIAVLEKHYSTTPSILLHRTKKAYEYINIGQKNVDYTKTFVPNLLASEEMEVV